MAKRNGSYESPEHSAALGMAHPQRREGYREPRMGHAIPGALTHSRLGWQPDTSLSGILTEIAGHAREHPDWLELSGL